MRPPPRGRRAVGLVVLAVAGLCVGAQFTPRAGGGTERLLRGVQTRFLIDQAFGIAAGGQGGAIAFAASRDRGLRRVARVLIIAGPGLRRDYARLQDAFQAATAERVLPALGAAIGRLRSDDSHLKQKVARVRVSSPRAASARRLTVRTLVLLSDAEAKFQTALINVGSADSQRLLAEVQSSLRASGRGAHTAMKLLGCLRSCAVAL